MDIKKMMKQFQETAQKMQEMQKEIHSRTYEGVSGGGIVKIEIDGATNITSIDINPLILKPEEKEIIEDLIIAAFSDAKNKMSKDSENSMSGMMGGSLPQGFKLPF